MSAYRTMGGYIGYLLGMSSELRWGTHVGQNVDRIVPQIVPQQAFYSIVLLTPPKQDSSYQMCAGLLYIQMSGPGVLIRFREIPVTVTNMEIFAHQSKVECTIVLYKQCHVYQANITKILSKVSPKEGKVRGRLPLTGPEQTDIGLAWERPG